MSESVSQLRPARAESAEGITFARYLDTAADGVFRILLGRRSDSIIARAFLEPGHDLSYEHVTFAELDGSVVGMVSAYTAAQHRSSSDGPLNSAAGTVRVARMAIISLLGRPLLRFLEHVPDGDFYLQAVAIDDDQRGRGVGSLLIDHAEARARQAGCSRLALDVAPDNNGARRLYESRGMTVEAESPHPPFLPNVRILRMVKAL